ncbi:hypothetical protein P4244_25815, partial [Bacillus thuringiensis]|nr:hypothetical protein [Bacillus thuringiensis]
GVTGPTGSVEFTSSAHIFNLAAFVSPSDGVALPLDTNGVINGTDISHIPPSTNVLLAPNHTYLVEYTVTAIPVNTKLTIFLSINGIAVPGSGFDDTSSEVTQITRTSGAIINTTGNVPSTLTVNAFYTGIQFPAAASPEWPNVSIRIVELN